MVIDSSLYDAQVLEVIGIEDIKKEPDASAKVGGQSPRAQGTSDSDINISDLLKLVKGDAEKYIPEKVSCGIKSVAQKATNFLQHSRTNVCVIREKVI